MITKRLVLVLCQLVAVLANSGPIGYQLFRNADRIGELRTGVHTKQFSSFDRKGLNDDGGPFACLSAPGANGKCVLAEHLGAGEVDSIWMTRDFGVFTKTGKIRIELDGVVVLDSPVQSVLNGEKGAPFVWPFVGNGEDTSGGGVIKVPMPYQRSMRIVVDTNPNYYHVTYRTFSNASDVRTFDPKEAAEDVVDLLREFAVRDPKPVKSDVKRVKNLFSKNVSGTSATLFESKTSGEITEIRIEIPSLVRSPRNIDDGRAFGKGGWSAFEARIDPKNNGIRISRRLDPNVVDEVANVLVDGVLAGKWDSTRIKGKDIWADEILVVKSELTKSKDKVNVRQEFVSSSLDFNEFRYEVDSLVDGQWIRTDVVDVGPDHPGEESAHRYKVERQTWSGQRMFRYAEDQKKLSDSYKFLNNTRIRATFDGRVTVDAPLGKFFGSGLGMYDVRKLWFAIDAKNAAFRSFWPMPYAREAKIELVLGQHSAVPDISTLVTYREDQSVKTRLESRRIGYFYATHNEEYTKPGRDYIFANLTGSGVFYGVSHTARGLIKTGNLRDYLEGDERVYIDGKRTPELYGTGTEDFYESGWYFRNGITFDMPLHGNPGYETKGDDCLYDCTQAIRLFAGGISFENGLVFGIEHGPVDDNEPGIYSSVSYYYHSPDPVIKQTDLITTADQQSRTQHNYVSVDETHNALSSAFEGQDYKVIHSAQISSATKQITFSVTIDAKNSGVRLFRTSDQKVGYQCVDVYVDDRLVGRWLQPLANQWSRMLDDSYDLPPSASKGKTGLRLKLVPVSHNGGPVLWTASQYKVMSILN